ncbi:BTAD domain-containing putative transcriptional regulator [Nocardioides sp.]|uniref:BTAD domain-containing putative transcriptional regulator n=1 Tax=Nocardioides sp. TaxID=35761 RepID=UPI002733E16A|nr:BTAD domain-containing putative transcriptional regulator [Nocardioides sp.]MDP3890074.1 BTAD domain-containing putative transcriptional regulator [Nocardioides sp.]
MDRTHLALCVDVLGTLVLRVAGAEVVVPGLRRRALLALLALEGESGASTERLVDSLWPDDPPENAVAALHSQVSRLRRHLGPLADRLERQPNGYRLRLQPFELDADAARQLMPSDPVAALALWRAPALVEFRSMPALELASVGLDELRLQLVDDQIEARLSRGHDHVAVDAAAAAAASPLRERTALLHVRALASEGRSAEAMSAAQCFRRRLVEETGLDPTPALVELEQQVAAGSVQRPHVVPRVAKPDGPMVGRQHDREEVVRLLGAYAIVTLTGPGGVGKTRLALDIAAGRPERGETVVVPLARVDRADRLGEAVVSALGLRVSGVAGPEQIAAGLASRDLLLVLDNCEHVIAACRALVVALRSGAPGVRVLATSRVTLQVPGEYVVRLQPLPVPREVADLASLRRQPSVRAFVEHARRRRTDFELTEDEAPDLVEVLRRLDGLPLGIELAARQVAVMPLRAVRQRLDRALDLSTGRQVEGEERQTTLRATIESSYRLLTDDEQRLLRAIAPFVGGVDLATVEVLAEPMAGDPLDLLHRLVDSSLLVADAVSARYGLLFTVRAFLVDEITRLGEVEETHARFVDRCRTVADDIGAQMLGPAEAEVDHRLREEIDNLRAARDLASADTRVAITIAVHRVVTWRDLREIWAWAVELVDDPVLGAHPARATILAAAAETARLVGDFGTAERRADESIASADRETQADALSRAWSVRAVVAHFRGDFETAHDAWLRAAEGAGAEASAFVGSAALAAAYRGDHTTARQLLDRARTLAACGSHTAFVAYVEGELCGRSDPAKAVPHYVEAIAEAVRVGCSFVEGVARVSLASTRTRIGDVPGAAEGFGYLIASWRRSGHTTQLWTAALLLVCADATPGAAAVDEEIARFSGRSYTPVEALVGAGELEELRAEAWRLGPAGVLDRALAELDELCG